MLIFICKERTYVRFPGNGVENVLIKIYEQITRIDLIVFGTDTVKEPSFGHNNSAEVPLTRMLVAG